MANFSDFSSLRSLDSAERSSPASIAPNYRKDTTTFVLISCGQEMRGSGIFNHFYRRRHSYKRWTLPRWKLGVVGSRVWAEARFVVVEDVWIIHACKEHFILGNIETERYVRDCAQKLCPVWWWKRTYNIALPIPKTFQHFWDWGSLFCPKVFFHPFLQTVCSYQPCQVYYPPQLL